MNNQHRSSYHHRSSQPLLASDPEYEEPPAWRQSRLGGRRGHSWSRRSRLLLSIVILMILLDFFTALILGTQVYTLKTQNENLQIDLSRSQEQLSQTMPELHKLRQDLDELIRGKLPRLRRLEYDQVLLLDYGYLKNITFSKVAKNNVQSYEYKLMVQNNTLALLWPEIQILLFNELGIQVGNAEIGTVNPVALKAPSLGVGEVRSYSALLQLTDKHETPAYFMVRTFSDNGIPDVDQPKLRTTGAVNDAAR